MKKQLLTLSMALASLFATSAFAQKEKDATAAGGPAS